MGYTEESSGDELRQAESLTKILLREGNNAESSGREICIQVCL